MYLFIYTSRRLEFPSEMSLIQCFIGLVGRQGPPKHCLNEVLEIVKCKDESGQIIIPIFYGLDPSHVRKQTGKFGEAFAKTCQTRTEDETKLWRQSLIDVANVLGYHSHNW
ncbi:hypothetical protein YC2023_084815 [Brassica napus]|uniref:TIR domain-containing protein n=2 Tax=Brassica TaxID=3705 RepID=A0A0D3D9I5_BRAOL|nr:unnamed protein product [Brassica napus]